MNAEVNQSLERHMEGMLGLGTFQNGFVSELGPVSDRLMLIDWVCTKNEEGKRHEMEDNFLTRLRTLPGKRTFIFSFDCRVIKSKCD